MDSNNLQETLQLHKLWTNHKQGGKRANLTGANLTGADLTGANLSGSKGLLSAIDYLTGHFDRTERGYIAYKAFGYQYPPPAYWVIAPGSVISEVVNPDRCTDCGCGVNVATLDWVRKNRQKSNAPIWRVLIEWAWLPGVVVPYNTDGKIRCERVRLLEEVEHGA